MQLITPVFQRETAMTVIVLSPDQSDAVANATGKVEVQDAQGNILGVISPQWSQADIEEAIRRFKSGGPWRTPEEVRERMSILEQQHAGCQP